MNAPRESGDSRLWVTGTERDQVYARQVAAQPGFGEVMAWQAAAPAPGRQAGGPEEQEV